MNSMTRWEWPVGALVWICAVEWLAASTMVARWRRDEALAPFADSGSAGLTMQHDEATTLPMSVSGVDGGAVYLNFNADPGVSTRLHASCEQLRTDSFGFSFWISPVSMQPGDNLLAMEMPLATSADFTRMAWQVQVGQDHGTGAAALELVVRGNHWEEGNFFGNVSRSIALPLFVLMDEWVHVAGGYDAVTGTLCIYLNGRDACAQGRAGARNSDGAWFNVGSVRNGLDFVGFGAIAAFDDIQLYDAPLSTYEVTWLRKNPGLAVTPDRIFKTTGFTGGMTNPAMVAIFTIHNNVTGKETIGVSYSTNHRDFTQYAGNPVIATDDQVFRDPDVFWHEPTQRWILLVARSEARTIRFYSSPDLKTWTQSSEFGPLGADNEIWEVPGLAEVPIRGMGNQKKWLLHVGAGTNKVQYWVGAFDGQTFTMDESTRAYLEEGTGIEGELFATFEGATWQETGWTVSGNAFGGEPAPRWWNQPVQGHLGQRMASSYADGDWHLNNTLTSPEFTISRNCINFQVGGGHHPGETCVNLVVGGNVVRSTTGDNSNVMRWTGWNVAEFKGQTARIRIVDNHGGFWGRIYADQITFSDMLVDHRREHAKWVELSPDFYAPRFVRDFDGTETDVKWLGWLGSWEYEENRPVPENWGKGAESIFRKLQLVSSARGYELAQEPVSEMQHLRGPVTNALPRRFTGTTALTEFQPGTNTYEIEAEFDTGSNADVGLNLCVGGTQRVTVGFNKVTSNLYLETLS